MGIRIWTTVLASALIGQAAAAETTSPVSDFPGGTVEEAVSKIFDGEGGEGGIGMSRMRPALVIPSLATDQITKAFAGNTLRHDGRFAIHFRPNGSVVGWSTEYLPAAASACPTPKGAGYMVMDGKCWKQREFDVSSRWEAKDGKLCMPGILEDPILPQYCYHAALVLNHVALFNSDGEFTGKGWTLAKGDVRARRAD
jgi:hypothetical protein